MTFKHVQQRDNRWCIVDLVGKHGRVRTVPMPTWVKGAIDAWTAEAKLSEGHVFRPVNRGDRVSGHRLSEKGCLAGAEALCVGSRSSAVAPHDLRRSHR
jgi:integrase